MALRILLKWMFG